MRRGWAASSCTFMPVCLSVSILLVLFEFHSCLLVSHTRSPAVCTISPFSRTLLLYVGYFAFKRLFCLTLLKFCHPPNLSSACVSLLEIWPCACTRAKNSSLSSCWCLASPVEAVIMVPVFCQRRVRLRGEKTDQRGRPKTKASTLFPPLSQPWRPLLTRALLIFAVTHLISCLFGSGVFSLAGFLRFTFHAPLLARHMARLSGGALDPFPCLYLSLSQAVQLLFAVLVALVRCLCAHSLLIIAVTHT